MTQHPRCARAHSERCSVQNSTWLIDPYWTLAPPLLVLFWLSHPVASIWTPRQQLSTALLCVWAARLTHSYFRREQWRFGAQEDWRYADMRRKAGKWWCLQQVRRTATHRSRAIRHRMLHAGSVTCGMQWLV